jgi:6-phosphogluconate dehydrogenase (decarboxylating)
MQLGMIGLGRMGANMVEYGIMAAYAEGLGVLREKVAQ